VFWYLVFACIGICMFWLVEYRTITTENLQGLRKYQSSRKIWIYPCICL